MSSSEAAHEFGALNTLLLVVILGLCILSAYLIKQNSLYYLPESAAAILVGIVVGGLVRAVYPSTEELNFLSFEPELFFFLLLPPIIFEAAYSLETKAFFANFWTISLFAVFGTIISTFIIGFLVYMLGVYGIAKIDTTSPMEALVFGALISSVDPVATLSIMGKPELNTEPLLYSLVFGESVLNDAVAIVLFKTFMSFYESDEEFSARTIPTIMVDFTICSLGSVVVGVLIGLACSYLCKHTKMRLYPEYEISILFLFAYGSFSFAESVQLSGIMSIFFCGIVLSHYNSYNLSPTSQITSHNIFKSMAVLSEYFVFLYIGMGVFTGKYSQINFTFFFCCTFFCLLARMFNIFPLSYIANWGRKETIPFKMQVVMWFAGLRGAICFALAQNLPAEHKELYVSTTLAIVISTTLICGGLTEPMLTKMGMRTDSAKNDDDDADGDTEAGSSAALSSGLSSGHSSNHSALCDHTQLQNDQKQHPQGDEQGVRGDAPSVRTTATSSSILEMLNGVTSRNKYELVPAAGSDNISSRSSVNNNNSSSNGMRSMLPMSVASPISPAVSMRSFMERIDSQYMRPMFGGP